MWIASTIPSTILTAITPASKQALRAPAEIGEEANGESAGQSVSMSQISRAWSELLYLATPPRWPWLQHRTHMDSIDDYFEYAMDLPESQRQDLLKRLKQDDPALAEQLQAALDGQVKNPDFLCQEQPPLPRGDEPDVLHHVTVVVGDVPDAIAWYSKVFRAELLRHDTQRAVFLLGAVELHLVDERQPAGLTIVRRDVAAMGPSRRRPDGVRGLHLVDPWGNAIEVIDRVVDNAGG